MVFQDFDQISERRRAERQRKLRKRILIGVICGFSLVLVVAAGVFAVVSKSSSNVGKAKQPQQAAAAAGQGSSSNKEASRAQKLISMVCNSTDFKDKCEGTLRNGNGNGISHPTQLLKVALTAADSEVKKAVDKTTSFKFEKAEEKAAFEDCKELFQDALEELEVSISKVKENDDDLGKLTSGTSDLNNWLSAVMSYQETCIEGFPAGKTKSDMEKALNDAKQLTSNSLAMISQVTSFLSTFQMPQGQGASRRRLLGLATDDDGLPIWMSHEDRRMLKGAAPYKPKPNVVVAKDATGDFKTISEALNAMPAKYQGRYIIYVKGGIYDETVIITKKMVNVTMYGDGSQKSVITGRKNFVDGVRTFQTATFAALGEGFIAHGMGFRNTAGPEKHQAVAARVQADRSIFLNCRFEGYQDTLYAQTHRQYYRSCVIAGTVDFIFGDAAAVFQNCLIMVRKPLPNQQNIVTAQGRIDRHETTGIVLHNCRIIPDKTLEPVKSQFKSYLGRPWKEFSRTVIMESTIEDIIHPDGWLPWEGDFALKTLYYAEYKNKGAGAKLNNRVNWPGYKKLITKQEATKFTIESFIQVDWINKSVPVHLGLYS